MLTFISRCIASGNSQNINLTSMFFFVIEFDGSGNARMHDSIVSVPPTGIYSIPASIQALSSNPNSVGLRVIAKDLKNCVMAFDEETRAIDFIDASLYKDLNGL